MNKIGDLRRQLFTPYDSKWNGFIRDLTAELEQKDELVERQAVVNRIIEWAKHRMWVDEFKESIR